MKDRTTTKESSDEKRITKLLGQVEKQLQRGQLAFDKLESILLNEKLLAALSNNNTLSEKFSKLYDNLLENMATNRNLVARNLFAQLTIDIPHMVAEKELIIKKAGASEESGLDPKLKELTKEGTYFRRYIFNDINNTSSVEARILKMERYIKLMDKFFYKGDFINAAMVYSAIATDNLERTTQASLAKGLSAESKAILEKIRLLQPMTAGSDKRVKALTVGSVLPAMNHYKGLIIKAKTIGVKHDQNPTIVKLVNNLQELQKQNEDFLKHQPPVKNLYGGKKIKAKAFKEVEALDGIDPYTRKVDPALERSARIHLEKLARIHGFFEKMEHVSQLKDLIDRTQKVLDRIGEFSGADRRTVLIGEKSKAATNLKRLKELREVTNKDSERDIAKTKMELSETKDPERAQVLTNRLQRYEEILGDNLRLLAKLEETEEEDQRRLKEVEAELKELVESPEQRSKEKFKVFFDDLTGSSSSFSGRAEKIEQELSEYDSDNPAYEMLSELHDLYKEAEVQPKAEKLKASSEPSTSGSERFAVKDLSRDKKQSGNSKVTGHEEVKETLDAVTAKTDTKTPRVQRIGSMKKGSLIIGRIPTSLFGSRSQRGPSKEGSPVAASKDLGSSSSMIGERSEHKQPSRERTQSDASTSAVTQSETNVPTSPRNQKTEWLRRRLDQTAPKKHFVQVEGLSGVYEKGKEPVKDDQSSSSGPKSPRGRK